MCIWYRLLQELEKSKIWPFCLHLNSQVPLNYKDSSQYNCWMLQKYFKMLITQESGCASGTDCFWNFNSSLKNQKPELFIWNLMVKYWSDRIKFWIYTAFKAFQTSHQLLSLVIVYRLNRGMRVRVKKEDALRVVPVPYFLLYIFLNFGTVLTDGKINNIIILQHQKPWYFSPINLRVQSGHQLISFLKCPLVPTFLLLIKARRCDQKTETFSLKEPFAWEFLVIFFPHACPHF